MKRVLVIGANSYIGKKFYEYVECNKELELQVDMVKASDGSWRNVDFSKYDSILHLAAIVHKKERKNMKSIYDEINHNLAVEVAKKAKNSQVRQFIFMSTAAVFGNETSCITKDTIPKPTTYYGKSKLAAEREIIKLSESNFKVVVVRPPMVYGEGCKGNYARLEKLAKYIPIFPEYHNKRSVLHIELLTKYLSDIIIYERFGVFHPHDKKSVSTFTLISNLRHSIGKKTKIVSQFNLIVLIFLKHNKFVKVFGDFFYENLQ